MMGFCIFGEEMVCLEIAHAVKTTKVYLLSVGHVRVNSLVKHSSADREVGGSIALASFFIIIGYLSKDFRRLKD